MEKTQQPLKQDDAERRIQPLSAEEINAVSGGQGPNRMGNLAASGKTLPGRGAVLSGGKTYGN